LRSIHGFIDQKIYIDLGLLFRSINPCIDPNGRL
jgi:hypothetical protein